MLAKKPEFIDQTPAGAVKRSGFRRFNKGTRKSWGLSKEETLELVQKESDPYIKGGLLRGWALTSDDPEAKKLTEELQDRFAAGERVTAPTEFEGLIEDLLMVGTGAGMGVGMHKLDEILGAEKDPVELIKKTQARIKGEPTDWKVVDKSYKAKTMNHSSGRTAYYYPSKGSIGYIASERKFRDWLKPRLGEVIADGNLPALRLLPLAVAGGVAASNDKKVKDNAAGIVGAAFLPMALRDGYVGAKGAHAVKSLRPLLPALAPLALGTSMLGMNELLDNRREQKFENKTKTKLDDYIQKLSF